MTTICKITATTIVEVSRSSYQLNKQQINKMGNVLLSCVTDKLKSKDREYVQRIWQQARLQGKVRSHIK